MIRPYASDVDVVEAIVIVISHGDAKPGNLLYRSSHGGGDLVLVDFGLARLAGKEAEAGGTLAYMAPEQRQGAITALSDIHAAGVIIVELLLGSPALSGWLGDRARLLRGEGRWDGTLPPSLGERTKRLRELLSAMMAVDPAARPTAAEAALALSML